MSYYFKFNLIYLLSYFQFENAKQAISSITKAVAPVNKPSQIPFMSISNTKVYT